MRNPISYAKRSKSIGSPFGGPAFIVLAWPYVNITYMVVLTIITALCGIGMVVLWFRERRRVERVRIEVKEWTEEMFRRIP